MLGHPPPSQHDSIFWRQSWHHHADDIWTLAKERANGISRTEVRDLFSRNKKAREIDRALTTLVDAGRLQRTRGHDRTTGRPAELSIPLQQTA